MIDHAIVRSLCVAALLWACAAEKQHAGKAQNAPPGSGGSTAGDPVASNPPDPAASNPPDRSKPMTGIDVAFTAFRAHAAKKLGVAPDQLEGGPRSEADIPLVKQRVGSVWAFIMRKPGDNKNEVRGWATADGTVVTLEQNLGLLFAEAGVWGGGVSPPLTAREIADRLLWSLGPKNVLYAALHHNIPAPTLALEGGAGTFTFTVNHRPSGPGGVGGGPPQLTRIDIALTPDRRATATQTRIPSP